MSHHPEVPRELRWYAVALRLFPPAHRRRFGPDQLLLAEDLLGHGTPPSRLWLSLGKDLGAAWWHAALTAGTQVPEPILDAAFPGFPERPAGVADTTRRALQLYAGADLRGREVFFTLTKEGSTHYNDVWQAMVDLADHGLIVDDDLPTRDRVNYRMDSRFQITAKGAEVAAGAKPTERDAV